MAAAEPASTDRLTGLVGDGRRVLLVAPWRRDGHPDHEAAGRVAAAVADRTGARLLEYPVWAWHWQRPGTDPWPPTVALPLEPSVLEAKQRAIACHTSQVAALSDRPGDEQLLGEDLLTHFRRRHELYVVEPSVDPVMDRLHADGREPWGADSRWYEERKRALLLSLLPARRHGRTLEVGCSTGVTSLALAERCSEVVAVDGSEAALRTARARSAGAPGLTHQRCLVPREWPEGRFDLVVVSELGYFLSPPDLELLVTRVAGCLEEDGVVALSHWRHPVEGWLLRGADVHRAFEDVARWSRLASYRDRDVEMLLLGPASRLPAPER